MSLKGSSIQVPGDLFLAKQMTENYECGGKDGLAYTVKGMKNDLNWEWYHIAGICVA